MTIEYDAECGNHETSRAFHCIIVYRCCIVVALLVMFLSAQYAYTLQLKYRYGSMYSTLKMMATMTIENVKNNRLYHLLLLSFFTTALFLNASLSPKKNPFIP